PSPRVNDNGSPPVTHRLAANVPITGSLMRYQLLSRRDLLSKTAARFRPQGRRRPGGAASEPLTVTGHLELLALGEHLACHFRHPVLIHHAVQAGATWPQIAVAPSRKSLHVRQDYADWADSQRALAKQSPGMTAGFSEAEHITALAAAACPPCPQCGSDEVAWDGNDGTSESWHCCACRRDYSAGGQS
ncbi:MAG: hypothetical protein ACRDND_34065, partial [Streptosporangiaceae bacterium]